MTEYRDYDFKSYDLEPEIWILVKKQLIIIKQIIQS